MLIKLTKASGGIKLVNTNTFSDVDEPQQREDNRFQNSRSVVTYDRPHPTKPNMRAFDFFQETPEEIFQLARGEIGSMGRGGSPIPSSHVDQDVPLPEER